MSSISFGKVHPIWHRDNADLLDGFCYVQEKVDGSQFSFCMTDGTVRFASRSREIPTDDEGMFKAGCDAIREIRELLVDGWTYHGEYLSKPKHNILCYDRVPLKHVALWGVRDPQGELWSVQELAPAAAVLGMEAVPILLHGSGLTADRLGGLMDRTSFLGGSTIEGVVVKREQLAGKLVSDRFKEFKKSKASVRKADNPVAACVASVATEARFHKIVQHMKEEGSWSGDYSDIPWLCRELQKDVFEECEDQMKDIVWKSVERRVRKMLPGKLVPWYKKECEG